MHSCLVWSILRARRFKFIQMKFLRSQMTMSYWNIDLDLD